MSSSTPILFLFAASPATLLAGCAADAGDAPSSGSEALHCSVAESCAVADEACLGAVDNAGQTRFGLRIAQLDVIRPAGLTTGTVGRVVAGDVLPSNASCQLYGS